MSWSISLSGPKEQVQAELEHAGRIIEQALVAVSDEQGTNVDVNVNGSAYSGSGGSGMSVGLNVSSTTPAPEVPQPGTDVTAEQNAANSLGGSAPATESGS